MQCMPFSSQIISEMLPEIRTMEKCDVHKSIIHSQNNNSFIYCLLY